MKAHCFPTAPRPLAMALLLLAGLAATGCASRNLTSISLPPDAPWQDVQTFMRSSSNDLTVTSAGNVLSAALAAVGQGVGCFSDQGGFVARCTTPDCNGIPPFDECVAQAPPGATVQGFTSVVTGYQFSATLQQPGFQLGLLRLTSPTAGRLGTIGISPGGNSILKLTAKAEAPGLLFNPVYPFDRLSSKELEQAALFDDYAGVSLSPPWPAFDFGYLCTDGTTTSCDPSQSLAGVFALCSRSFNDEVLFRVDQLAVQGRKIQCGAVKVSLYVNPEFQNPGQCLAFSIAQNCLYDIQPANRPACITAQLASCLGL